MAGKIYKHKRTSEKIEVIGKGEFWVIYKVLTGLYTGYICRMSIESFNINWRAKK